METLHRSTIPRYLIVVTILTAVVSISATTARAADPDVVIFAPATNGTVSMNGMNTVTIKVQMNNGFSPYVARIRSADGATNYGDTNTFTAISDPNYTNAYSATITMTNGNYNNITVYVGGRKAVFGNPNPVLTNGSSTGVTITAN